MLRLDGTGGSDMFATYSGEFEDYRQQITHAIEDYGVADAAKRSVLSRKILQDIDELGDIIKQMELEVRSHQGPARQTLNERLVGFRKSRQEVQKAWRVAKEQADAGSRDTLLSGARGAAGGGEGVYAQTNTRCVAAAAQAESDRCPLLPALVPSRARVNKAARDRIAACGCRAERARWTACSPRPTSGSPRRGAHSPTRSAWVR